MAALPPTSGTGGTVPAPWRGHEPGSREYRRILIALVAAAIASFAQLYSPQGVLPLIGRAFDVSVAASAVTISAGTLGLALSVLTWSWLADRIGRVQAMKVAMAAAAVLGLLVPVAPDYTVLVLLRVVQGAALAGVPALALAYLHEEIAPRATAVAAGSYISGNTIGGISGRLIAAPVADWFDWRIGLAAVGVVCALAAGVFIVVVPPSRGWTRPSGRPEVGVLRGVAHHLRDRGTLVLFGQAFLLMGGFVAVYNYLAYRLEDAPFDLSVGLVSLLFLAYLAGTVSSRWAGGLAGRYGRRRVLMAGVAVMIAGVALTLPPWLPTVLIGLVVMTAGFFAAHSIASGWVGHRAQVGRAQATALYNLAYYGGSSLVGWLAGYAFALGWWGVAAVVMGLAGLALAWAALSARD